MFPKENCKTITQTIFLISSVVKKLMFLHANSKMTIWIRFLGFQSFCVDIIAICWFMNNYIC